MDTKALVWTGFFIGSTIGSFVPFLWGGGLFSSVIFSAILGIAGIWAGYKVSQM
jgi:hypothetical protein